MKKKTTSLIVITLLAFSALGIVFLTTARTVDLEPLNFGPDFRTKDLPIEGEALIGGNGASITAATEGDLKVWLALDNYYGYYFFTTYELRAVGLHTEIWVQVDLSYPDGDPRAYPEVSDEQIDYLLEEYESNIYPVTSQYFGVPDYHDGTYSLLEAWGYLPPGYYYDDTGRDIIMVSNVRDTSYYDASYPYYIAGFYSPSFEAYFDRNIISIDSHDWINRVGPDGSRPNMYEGTIAHEEQHLIHDDYNTADALFMNEGCSVFAEMLCGYGIPWGDINSYLATPDNSLVEWGDQGGINTLADYGAAGLWAIYLNDRFGPAFLGKFVQDGFPGITGLNKAFDPLTFDDVYRDWKIANLIHSGDDIYNYKSLDLADAEPIRVYEVQHLPVPWTSGSSFGTTITILGYDTGISGIASYGSDYIEFTKWPTRTFWEKILNFDGDDGYTVYENNWELTEDGWYSGAGHLFNDVIAGKAYIDPTDPTLTMTTYWDIEDNWDFGFVQVSTDNGVTWTSLANMYTTNLHDPSAHPDVVSNLPGLTGMSLYYDPDGWITMDFDLTGYKGQTVLIGFRFVTDWATVYEGWYISDASVSDEPLDLDYFYPTYDVDFQVTLVSKYQVTGHSFIYTVEDDLPLLDIDETGSTSVTMNVPHSLYMIVTPVVDVGFVDYQFMVENNK